jgi:L-ribulose-5-phosphate 4-epimerase
MSRYPELREECWTANLRLPELKLADMTFGNVSVIDRASGVFAIKPSGVGYDKLTPDDLVLLDLDGKVVEGNLRPSSDTPTHRRLLQAFTGIRAVVHTHSRNATAFAQAGKAIPCFGTTHADYFYGEVPVTLPMTDTEVASAYEWATGNAIVERFTNLDPEEVPAVLVNGHAPFVWGLSGAKALETALALEIIAEMAIKTLLINPAAKPISQHLLARHFKRKHGSQAYYGQLSGPFHNDTTST